MDALQAAVENLQSLVSMVRNGAIDLDDIDDDIVVVAGPRVNIAMKDLLCDLVIQPDDIATRRARMVERIRLELQALDVPFDADRVGRLLRAMSTIPRELFVDLRIAEYAYLPYALSIGQEQTISQPYMVAIMVLAAGLSDHHVVLDVGTGSGYQAAILSKLVTKVVSIEVREAIAHRAAATFAKLGLAVDARVGDGLLGAPSDGPFDAIIVAAAADRVPMDLITQLKIGGRLIMPIRVGSGDEQLFVFTRWSQNDVRHCSLGPCFFVPAAGDTGTDGMDGLGSSAFCYGHPITAPPAIARRLPR